MLLCRSVSPGRLFEDEGPSFFIFAFASSGVISPLTDFLPYSKSWSSIFCVCSALPLFQNGSLCLLGLNPPLLWFSLRNGVIVFVALIALAPTICDQGAGCDR